ncbi:MAG TPA: acyl-CoA dehydrogenase family protein [Stellaceae bacterium]|nr:acyl-CoA dehydrogenase family protein [Stellaceae bacterium]
MSGASDRTMTRDEVIERARGIAKAAAAQVGRAETLRRLPPETVAAIMGSGLMPMMRPRRFGGFGGDWLDLLNACAEIGRVCGAASWCFSFLIHHQWIFAYFPGAAQDRVYAAATDPKFVVSFAPVGKVRAVAGGWELSGEWPWGSGGDHCDWAMVNALIPGADGGPPHARMFLLQPGQFRMRDVWHSVGLKGSGTNNIVVDPVFVPAELTLNVAEAQEATAPGCRLDEGVLFRSPLTAQAWVGIVSPLIGVAMGACDAFVDRARTKVSTMGEVVAEAAPMQVAIGESQAEIEAAVALAERINEALFANQPVTLEHRVRYRRNATAAARLALRAVDRLFDLGGAQGLAEAGALQRHWRDAHAIAHHFALSTVGFQNSGRIALGLGPAPGDPLY